MPLCGDKQSGLLPSVFILAQEHVTVAGFAGLSTSRTPVVTDQSLSVLSNVSPRSSGLCSFLTVKDKDICGS